MKHDSTEDEQLSKVMKEIFKDNGGKPDVNHCSGYESLVDAFKLRDINARFSANWKQL